MLQHGRAMMCCGARSSCRMPPSSRHADHQSLLTSITSAPRSERRALVFDILVVKGTSLRATLGLAIGTISRKKDGRKENGKVTKTRQKGGLSIGYRSGVITLAMLTSPA